MKNFFLMTLMAVSSFSSFAANDEVMNFLNPRQELDLTIPKEILREEKPAIKVVEKYDSIGVFYDVEIQSSYFIPTDVTAGVGINSPSKSLEAEAFVGLNAIRLISGSSVHIPYGARVRVALNKGKTVYAEYTYQDVIHFDNTNGLFEKPLTLSLVKIDRKKQTYYGCGIGQTIHHAWGDEFHAPEKSYMIECRLGKRF